MEKIYNTMRGTGACNIALGVIILTLGIVIGTISIITGGILLKRKSEVEF